MTAEERHQRRQQLLSFYRIALERVHGDRVVSDYLAAHPLAGRWAVVAIGKAASAMAEGAQQQLQERLHSGLVITRRGYTDSRFASGVWRSIESGHPVPDESSLQAGKVLLEFLETLPNDMPLLFLLSGGASSLAEVLPPAVSLEALIRANEWLLASGLGIGQMNTVRRQLSLIKGGRLARSLKGRHCLQLLISDVPGDDPEVIGSAPLYPVTETPLPANLPDWLTQLLQHTEAVPAEDDPVFTHIETHIIANNGMALQALKSAAETAGFFVTHHPGHYQGEALMLAQDFCRTLIEAGPGLHIWGGESSVKLPQEPGTGGRNQHLALAAAEHLAGHDDILFLAAATDGSDGPGDSAGALVDGGSNTRGEDEGYSLQQALIKADSGSFLEASGDLIETGPTGSNVMDLVIGWKLGRD